MPVGPHVKYPLFLSDFNETWILLSDFLQKELKYNIPLKSAQWEPSCSLRMDKRTDRHDEAKSRLYR